MGVVIRSWWRNRRWWRLQPPREGWVVLLDADGQEVTERIPFVATPRREQPGHGRPGDGDPAGSVAWGHVRVQR